MSEIILDRTDAPRRHVIINIDTDELGNDLLMTPSEADMHNTHFREHGDPRRWYVWADEAHAA